MDPELVTLAPPPTQPSGTTTNAENGLLRATTSKLIECLRQITNSATQWDPSSGMKTTQRKRFARNVEDMVAGNSGTSGSMPYQFSFDEALTEEASTMLKMILSKLTTCLNNIPS